MNGAQPWFTCITFATSLLIGCGRREVELSTPPHLESSPDPTILGSINEQVGWLTVDEERLYWVGTFATTEWETYQAGNTGSALHSCSKAHCSDSLATYDATSVDAYWGLRLRQGEIYWQKRQGARADVVACPVAGCSGAPRVVVYGGLDRSLSVVLGADAMYYDEPGMGLLRKPFSGQANPEQLLSVSVSNSESIFGLAIHGDFLYWFSQSNAPNVSSVALRRTRATGGSDAETLAEHLQVLRSWAPQNTAAFTHPGLAFDETYVYWTENTLTGSLRRCPLAGCRAAPEVLASPIRAPLNLLVDGTTGYFQYDDTLYGNSLARCLLEHCEPSAPIVSGLDGWDAIAIDDRYVYAATTEQGPNPDQPWDTPDAHIRRFAK